MHSKSWRLLSSFDVVESTRSPTTAGTGCKGYRLFSTSNEKCIDSAFHDVGRQMDRDHTIAVLQSLVREETVSTPAYRKALYKVSETCKIFWGKGTQFGVTHVLRDFSTPVVDEKRRRRRRQRSVFQSSAALPFFFRTRRREFFASVSIRRSHRFVSSGKRNHVLHSLPREIIVREEGKVISIVTLLMMIDDDDDDVGDKRFRPRSRVRRTVSETFPHSGKPRETFALVSQDTKDDDNDSTITLTVLKNTC